MAFKSKPFDNRVGPGSTETSSLCPVCLKRVDAERRHTDAEVWLHKSCPEHGEFSTPVWRGPPLWEDWRRPKLPSPPDPKLPAPVHGCPFDCGLCRGHRQRSCTVIVDVTERCNLVCPVCFAGSTREGPDDPDRDELGRRFDGIFQKSPGCNVQLSGGEPTVRDDLPDIVAMGRSAGFGFIQVNTNGIRIARDEPFVKRLAEAGLDSIFLQFDGTSDTIYRKLRGRALFREKVAAVAMCEKAHLGVVLVVTVVPGLNDRDLGPVLKFAMENVPVVRGVHFQPISYFGRFPAPPTPSDRITLPELMRAIESQTMGAFPVNRFSPPGCENAMCSFSAKFLVQSDQSVHPLLPIWQGCREGIETAEEGARRSISQTARQWSGVPRADLFPPPEKETKLQADGSAGAPNANSMDLDQFIRQVRTRTLAVSAMAFQDAWTLDLDRVKDCCIHVADTRGRLIPFCLYHLTSASGKGLYRP